MPGKLPALKRQGLVCVQSRQRDQQCHLWLMGTTSSCRTSTVKAARQRALLRFLNFHKAAPTTPVIFYVRALRQRVAVRGVVGARSHISQGGWIGTGASEKAAGGRSEEHTSELQSLRQLV